MLVTLIESVYNFLWGDLLTLPLGGVTLNLSLMVILLFTAGIYFTLRTRLLPMRLFRDMLDAVCEKKQGKQGGGFRGWCRGRVLDVGHGAAGGVHFLCGVHAGAEI